MAKEYCLTYAAGLHSYLLSPGRTIYSRDRIELKVESPQELVRALRKVLDSKRRTLLHLIDLSNETKEAVVNMLNADQFRKIDFDFDSPTEQAN